jgi:hypothetical protein
MRSMGRSFEPPLGETIFGALPGEGYSYHVRRGEGPAVTKTPDGSYHVAYVRITDAEGGAIGGADGGVEVLYQESFSDPFRAGREYQELVDYAPALPEEPDARGLAERRRAYLKRDLLERKIEEQQEKRRYLVEQHDEDLGAFGLKE